MYRFGEKCINERCQAKGSLVAEIYKSLKESGVGYTGDGTH